MSTSATNGRGKAKITSAGMATQVGQIARQLKDAKKKGNRLRPLQMALNRLLCGASWTTVASCCDRCLFCVLFFALSVFVSSVLVTKTWKFAKKNHKLFLECFKRPGITHVVRCFLFL